jgi:hypothetical protein
MTDVFAQDPLEHGGRAGVATVQREQDLLLAPEVLDRLREERVDVRARHGEPLLGPRRRQRGAGAARARVRSGARSTAGRAQRGVSRFPSCRHRLGGYA